MKPLILMGVSGSGKSTIGELLAEKTGGIFLDGDDLHPLENVAKMRSGIPLTDEDRQGWLLKIAEEIRNTRTLTFIACSALKASYRAVLAGAEFIFLTGPKSVLEERLGGRENHFMPPGLLESQLETLEPPEDALVLDIRKTPAELVAEIIAHYDL